MKGIDSTKEKLTLYPLAANLPKFFGEKIFVKKNFLIFLQNFFEHEKRFLWAENHIAWQRNMVFPRAWDTNR